MAYAEDADMDNYWASLADSNPARLPPASLETDYCIVECPGRLPMLPPPPYSTGNYSFHTRWNPNVIRETLRSEFTILGLDFQYKDGCYKVRYPASTLSNESLISNRSGMLRALSQGPWWTCGFKCTKPRI